MTHYHTLLKAIFGSQYAAHMPYLRAIHLYCLFIITLVLALCLYGLLDFQRAADQTFLQRVRALRTKYAEAQRPGYD